MAIKVLLLFANQPFEPLMPLGIALLATVLEDNGHEVCLFDTTLYPNHEFDSQAERISSGQIKCADYTHVGVVPKATNMHDDFKDFVQKYKPDLIGVSCVEPTYNMALSLLARVKDTDIPTIMGGAFATFSPHLVLSNTLIDMVCVGEGEEAIVQVAHLIEKKHPIHDIPNVWVKRGNVMIPPPVFRLVDINSLPIPRFDVFETCRIYRSMAGKIYRMLPVEISRGCPYRCTYCSAPAYRKLFAHNGQWLRFKSVDSIIKEIEILVSRYDVEYLYFVSETFLALPKVERKKFYRLYANYGIPFWFNTRPETINNEDVQDLKAVGCHRLSIGIESGNEQFRRRMLQRNYSNDTIIKSIRIIQDAGIQLSVNNMIGFPDETRELINDTINLNCQFTCDSHGVSVFQPFRGTPLHEYCVKKGYWDANSFADGSFSEPRLDMPSLSREEISGLYRTFNLYCKLDKSYWDDIRLAESFTPEGDAMLAQLMNFSMGA